MNRVIHIIILCKTNSSLCDCITSTYIMNVLYFESQYSKYLFLAFHYI